MEIKINQSRNYSSLSTAKTYQEVSSEIEALLNQYKQLKRTMFSSNEESASPKQNESINDGKHKNKREKEISRENKR